MADGKECSTEHREEKSSAVVEHLRNAIRQAMKDHETMEVVELLCENSGWTVEGFLQAPHEFTNMELFLLSIPKLPQLRLFPYLVVVKIIHVGLESMENFSNLHYVEELWLGENNIRKIEGLQNMTKLRALYLQGNLIDCMDDIPHLPNLQKLWLCNNNLRRISGLSSLPKLKHFWVASNRIARFDGAFTSNMTCLEELNISNNKIDFLGQLIYLSVLRSLRSLWLSDPMYGDVPVCRLSNYTTFTLCHLPQLELLDGVAITAEQRSLALTVYAKKNIYYSMRRAILNRNIGMLLKRVNEEAEKMRDVAREALRQIELGLIDLHRCGNLNSLSTKLSVDEKQTHLAKMLDQARETREVEVETLERQYSDAYQRMMFESDSLYQRLMLELNSCGNIRLEEGKDGDSWCENAKELLSSRFDSNLYEKMGVTGVKTNRVFRIMCQGLRERFDSRIRELDVDLADTRNRRALVRLFSIIPKNSLEQRGFLHEVMANGFVNLYSEDEGIPLTNSLYYADQERLFSVRGHRDMYGVTVPAEALSGQLVVSRLFLGKCVSEMGGTREDETAGEQIFMKRDRRKCTRRQYGDEVFSVYRTSQHDPSVKVWHMFDKSLLLPEYVIDFTYTTKGYFSNSPVLSIYDDLGELQSLMMEILPGHVQDAMNDLRTVGYPMIAFYKWLKTNTFHLFVAEQTNSALRDAKEFCCNRRNVLPIGCDSSIDTTVNDNTFDNGDCRRGFLVDNTVSFYDISSQQLTSIPQAFITSVWTSLTELFLHNNNISYIPWDSLAVATPSLAKLDLGENILEHLDLAGAKLPSLHTLCLSFNRFTVLNELLQLCEGTPRLENFKMNHNPWMSCKAAELFCYAVIPHLKRLNGISISRHIHLSFLKKRTFSIDKTVLQYIISEEQKLHTRDYFSAALNNDEFDFSNIADTSRRCLFEQVFAEIAEKKEDERLLLFSKTNPSLSPSFKSVRFFSFCVSLLRDIKWVSCFSQLRHLCLSSHLIEDISSLAEMRHLKTLDLSDNIVKSAKPLCKLRLLLLDLSRNLLTDTQGLEELTELRYLSISQNFITDVSKLQNCTSLEQLYFGQNLIKDVHNLYPLHLLAKLVSMDVAGNPCADTVNEEESKNMEYRNYLIYNIPKLKVLDGVPVGELDHQQARELFAGRINSELLVERVGDASRWNSVLEMDLSQCGLREVMMLEPFVSLQVLHLHHNSLVQINGLASLNNLVALNLSHNRLGSFPVGQSLQVLKNLRSLSLESNHITDIVALGLNLPRLKFLNLKGNGITSIGQGLQGLTELQELLLDNNKLRSLGHDCFANNLQLTDISAEENYIRFTEGLQPLVHLEMLGLGSNRVVDLRMLLNDLRNASSLANVTLIGNAVSRKPPYRLQMIAAFPSLAILDQKEVTVEEREKAEMARAMEYVTPHNVVLDPSFSVEAVGGARLNAIAVSPRSVPQPPRFPVTASNNRLPLPSFKNSRIMTQARYETNKGVFSRVNGGR